MKTLARKVACEEDVLSAWRMKDRVSLERIVRVDLPALIAQMRAFCADYRADWQAMSQPFGFETIQRRNAAQLARLEEALLRLKDYLDGTASTVPELDEAMRPFGLYQEQPPVRW